ncbi:MAG: SUMF1/EgtB/PvdO family nonheme iron enzyme [Prosthecobacter sp.]
MSEATDPPANSPKPADAAAASLIHANAGRLLQLMVNTSPSDDEHEGSWIGPYRLCELLGEGGFGSVWRAEQTEQVRREVAVKVIKPGMDTAQVLRRFNVERQALAGLDHPNIARMLDAGATRDGRPYFTMEIVRGGPITQWCRDRALPLRDRLLLFVEVCQAVQHAHENGILHRDLKPGNVLVTEIGGRPVPKIIDFGVAKAMSADSPEELMTLTLADQVIGTLLYMAPEQIEGARELDARSDVYALGVLLYELLADQPPFDVKSLAAEGREAMKRKLRELQPERPSTRLRGRADPPPQVKTPRSPAVVVPADLDWITMRALEKERGRRYATAAELAEDVLRHLNHQPVLARPPSRRYAAQRWARQHRAALITFATALVSAVVAAVWTHWTQPQPQQAAAAAPPGTVPPLRLAADGTHTNSLGMKFVPVPGTGLLFCIHETRMQDYATYAAQSPGIDPTWADVVDGAGPQWGPARQDGQPGAEEGNRPVKNVAWDDAQRFCHWLSLKEGRTVRLPTSAEWNQAAGVTPAGKDFGPWGGKFPPKTEDRAGNYADEAYHKVFSDKAWIAGYEDGFPTTAPVMSFKPNALGLYDLGGNVEEWCADVSLFDPMARTRRGAAFHSSAGLESGSPIAFVENRRYAGTGFRCVVEWEPPASDSARDEKAPAPFPDPLPAADVKRRSITNTLGMTFVPVPGTQVLVCAHETRRKDFAAFATATKHPSDDWKNQSAHGIPCGADDDHPVVGVTWKEADLFCQWLTRLDPGIYRLPSDREWSLAVGLGPYEPTGGDNTPKVLGLQGRTEMPHGQAYPPVGKAGNYADDALLLRVGAATVILGYNDRHATTSRAGGYMANPFGIYDLGGNVAEWCQDYYDERFAERVIRGGSWKDGTRELLFSARRTPLQEEVMLPTVGFRCVFVPREPAVQRAEPSPPPPASPLLGEDSIQTNSLGMKFRPVPGTEVLFCIHETRRQDYAAFAAAEQPPDNQWRTVNFQGKIMGDDHPVSSVCWLDAMSFCQWLSRKEGRVFRLPTDLEWSIAVGLGDEGRTPASTPALLHHKVLAVYPWAGGLPLPAREAGNYADVSFHTQNPSDGHIRSYNDGHAGTAPVMSYKPNALGLYDMGGNVEELCLDIMDPASKELVSARGSDFANGTKARPLLSSFRCGRFKTDRFSALGFRIVMEAEAVKKK